jgi:hypothetical protein
VIMSTLLRYPVGRGNGDAGDQRGPPPAAGDQRGS